MGSMGRGNRPMIDITVFTVRDRHAARKSESCEICESRHLRFSRCFNAVRRALPRTIRLGVIMHLDRTLLRIRGPITNLKTSDFKINTSVGYSNDGTVLLDLVQIASDFRNFRLLRDIRTKTKINRTATVTCLAINKDKFEKSFEMLELDYPELKKIK